jgi:hypothetical protein
MVGGVWVSGAGSNLRGFKVEHLQRGHRCRARQRNVSVPCEGEGSLLLSVHEGMQLGTRTISKYPAEIDPDPLQRLALCFVDRHGPGQNQWQLMKRGEGDRVDRDW